MTKTILDVRLEQEKLYGTMDNTFNDFPIGTEVKIITPCEDFTFFYGETGKVIKNSGKYLGICVVFDEPRHFTDGTVQTSWNFNPKSLCLLNEEIRRIAQKNKEKKLIKQEEVLIKQEEAKRSERFMLIDL